MSFDPLALLVRLAETAPLTRAVLLATMVLGLAGLVAALARRASASTRHSIWLVALATSVILAVAAVFGPVIEIRGPATTTHVPFAPTAFSHTADLPAPSAASTLAAPLPAPSYSSFVIRYRAPLAFVMWLVGVMLIAARCIAGHVGIARLITRATPTDLGRRLLLEGSTRQANVRSHVTVYLSDDVEAPVTIGARRPVVLLPREAASWSDERIHIVLVHELAHVARFDYVAQLVATVACAIYWFHPAVWLASARLRAEAEQAADDRVLAAGVDGVTYATHLLELAARADSGAASSAVAVGIARSNRLERRFQSMLDSTRSRGTVPLRHQAVASLAIAAMVVPLAGFRMIPGPIAAPEQIAMVVETSPPPRMAAALAPASTIALATRTAVTAPVESDTTIERTLSANAGERISLTLPTGGQVTIQAWDQPQVRMRAVLSGDQSRTSRLDFERVNGGIDLRLSTDHRRGSTSNSNRFELWLPRRYDVRISSAGGGVTIDGLEGTFSGTTGGGEIIIRNARGVATLNTGGGSINLSGSHLDGYVSTGGGQALVNAVTGSVSVTSGSGPVIRVDDGRTVATTVGGSGYGGSVGRAVTATTAQSVVGSVDVTGGTTATIVQGAGGGVGYGRSAGVATTVQGDVIGFGSGSFSMTKGGGEIELDAAPNGGTFSTGGGAIRIGSSSGSLRLNTGGGDILVGRMGGDVSATTGAGDVEIVVVNENGVAHNVMVTSGNGRVTIDLPANIDARFDLETAYTENYRGRTEIRSDFRVDVTESADWDNRQGTPRKYVRAVGSSGNGRGLIRIRTVNGDVVIRRR